MPPAKAAHLVIVCEPDGTVRVSIPGESVVLPESDENRRTSR
jgi:hypothetical protein